jgi:glycosyltransferase involved in cell wall biosynthesis
LNSDTLLPPGALQTLLAALYARAEIGSATPFSNDATICGYPRAERNPAPDLAAATTLDALAARSNGDEGVEIPTGVGFCLLMRHDCIARTGRFRPALFAQGYGEENDWCERARALGWRHVAVPEAFVAHHGSVSFGRARTDLIRRNLAILDRLHPGYATRVAAHIAADPLRPARQRLDAARWAEARRPGAVLLVTHAGTGGVAQVLARRCAAIRAEGLRPVVLGAEDGVCSLDEAGTGPWHRYPNLRHVLPRDLDALEALLAADRPVRAEIHHLLGHDPSVMDLPARLRIPFEIWVHDYAAFCPRIALFAAGRYCGEPDLPGCEACVATGAEPEQPTGPAVLRARAARHFQAATRVVVPCADVLRRMRRHLPQARYEVHPWEDDTSWPPLRPPRPAPGLRIAVVGAIGPVKGYDVLLAAARDAAERRLPLEFIVVGYSRDDAALLETGRVFVTGEFRREEAAAVIAAQDPEFAFLPSVWPETWCYALSDAWAAGLAAAVFDLGAQAERVRRTRRGWVLPLGLSAAPLNDALMTLKRAAGANRPARTSAPAMFGTAAGAE